MIHTGDAIAVLRTLPDESAQMCVTSPPYFGLRDYGNDGQIGLEASPSEYIARLVAVFDEVRRVLKPSGLCWLNLGDSYAGSWSAQGRPQGNGQMAGRSVASARQIGAHPRFLGRTGTRGADEGYKPKDLIGIPWRVAFALQDAGWYLRCDVIWSKPNPMPESVTDRPTKAHEYIFLFAKGQHRERRIQFLDIEPETVHFGTRLGGSDPSLRSTSGLCVRLATALFQAAQKQNDFSLPPFYSEKWKDLSETVGSDLVSGLPPIQRLAAYAARFLHGDASTKEFLCQIHRFWSDLSQRKHLVIGRLVAECMDSPGVLVDANGSVTIHDSGEVRKVDFLHGVIIDTVPTTCKYYYNAEAIKEPGVYAGPNGAQKSPHAQGFGRRTPEQEAARQDKQRGHGRRHAGFNDRWDAMEGAGQTGVMRNKRSVWSIATRPFPEAHFATFPEEIPTLCILAGSRPGDVVLDPFNGAGTTGVVCEKLQRRYVGIELNPQYVEMAERRIRNVAPLFRSEE